jgi:2-dehydro-3-deoxyphosphogluconate aldolase / (4S)-4-hydroxy-2-oxoglutarate aldolase
VTDVLAALARHRVIPVLTVDEVRHARPVIDALTAGGLPCAEVTFRTAAAVEVLREMTGAGAEAALVGAGSVLRPEQVDLAVSAGARFIVSPGFSPAVVQACSEQGVPVIPGVATATEISAALEAGVATVKLFPAEQLGGIAMIDMLHGPFPDVRFMPTGGIGPEQLPAYLAHPAVVAVGGSWMASRALIRAERFAEITRLAAGAVALGARPRLPGRRRSGSGPARREWSR